MFVIATMFFAHIAKKNRWLAGSLCGDDTLAEFLDIAETMAVAIATPALGPSLGIAPAGTWTWTSIEPSRSSGMRSEAACVAA